MSWPWPFTSQNPHQQTVSDYNDYCLNQNTSHIISSVLQMDYRSQQLFLLLGMEEGFKVFSLQQTNHSQYHFRETVNQDFTANFSSSSELSSSPSNHFQSSTIPSGIKLLHLLYDYNVMLFSGGGKHPYYPETNLVFFDMQSKKVLNILTFATPIVQVASCSNLFPIRVEDKKDSTSVTEVVPLVVLLDKYLYLYWIYITGTLHQQEALDTSTPFKNSGNISSSPSNKASHITQYVASHSKRMQVHKITYRKDEICEIERTHQKPVFQLVYENSSDSVLLLYLTKEKGCIQIDRIQVKSSERQPLYTIQAHDSFIAQFYISSCTNYISTASDKGTIIRIFQKNIVAPQQSNVLNSLMENTGVVIQEQVQFSKVRESRRGTANANIHSLAIDMDCQVVACISDHPTIHIFGLPDLLPKASPEQSSRGSLLNNLATTVSNYFTYTDSNVPLGPEVGKYDWEDATYGPARGHWLITTQSQKQILICHSASRFKCVLLEFPTFDLSKTSQPKRVQIVNFGNK